MSRKTLSLLLVVLLVFTSVQSVFATEGQSDGPFKDVPRSHWASGAIEWMVEQGILDGVGNGKFNPSENVTREQFAKIMVLALDIDTQPSSGTQSFRDVPKSSWAWRYVESAKPYLTGYRMSSWDEFQPKGLAVREDMAVALVKALGLQNETVDSNAILSVFGDQSKISTNLRKHVAIAVKNGLMEGYNLPNGGGRSFGAQETLNRASASVLIYNAISVSGEKITYDDLEKVTYDSPTPSPSATPTATPQPENSLVTPNVRAVAEDGGIRVSWDRIDSENFSGYKVVASRYEDHPIYPQNGYYKWITDRNVTSVFIPANSGYSGGDVDGKIRSGVAYWFSVTALYNDMGSKVAGNAVKLTVPGSQTADTAYTKPSVSLETSGDSVIVRWNRISDSRLQGYKVVLSREDSTPAYPENGYIVWLTDRNITSFTVSPGDSYNGGDFETVQSGRTYYFSVTAVYNDTKVAGNVVRKTMPQ